MFSARKQSLGNEISHIYFNSIIHHNIQQGNHELFIITLSLNSYSDNLMYLNLSSLLRLNSAWTNHKSS